MADRMDTGISDLYPEIPSPGCFTPWQVAIIFAVNDSTIRAHIERGSFPGVFKNAYGELQVPRSAIIARLQALEEQDQLRWERQERERQRAERAKERDRNFVPEPFVPTPKPPPDTFILYWHYLEDENGLPGELLYVGLTTDLPRRLKEHARDKNWWKENCLLVKTRPYDSQAELEEAERQAIRNLRPLYNVTYNGGERDDK